MKTDKENKETPVKEENEEIKEEAKSSVVSDEESTESSNESSNDNDTDPSEGSSPSPEDMISQYKQEKEEYEDKYIRLMAEFDNFRKRVIKEKTDLILNGGERVITSILPVLDDIERAEENMKDSPYSDSLQEGVHLIFDKLKDILQKQGLSKIESVGHPFNDDYHEAIAMVPGQPEELSGKVIDCVQDGYKLNDKVIRHSKVAVAE